MPFKVQYHRPAAKVQAARPRSGLLKLYSTAPWRRFRADIRAARVLCEPCRAKGRTVEGTTVHHKIDPRDRPDLTFSPENVQLVCPACHNAAHGEKGKR